MNNVQVFDFKQNVIRATVDVDNNPLFVARDVALALGYARPADAVTQHCKNQVKSMVLGVSPSTIELVCIYEPDLYRLIFRSKLDSSVAFQDWVFNEVLPTIRKTGSYSAITTDQRLDRLEAELHALKTTCKSAPLLTSYKVTEHEAILRHLKNKSLTLHEICQYCIKIKPFKNYMDGSKTARVREIVHQMIQDGTLKTDNDDRSRQQLISIK